MKASCTIILLLFLISFCNAQEYPAKEIDLPRLYDEFFGYSETDELTEDRYDNMVQLLSNPIDLNRALPEDFRAVSFLTETQIQNILSHRTNSGPFLSVYELQSIPELDNATIYKLIPFVKVYDPSSSVRNILYRITHDNSNYLVMRIERMLETRKGFSTPNVDQRFKGSANRLYFRLRSGKASDVSFGVTAEKDAGEQFDWSPSSRHYGLDYWSAHLRLQNKGRIKNLIVGDFQSQFGQGLIFGGAFGVGKGAETVLAVRRGNVGFIPYSSVNEVTFNRGVATTLQLSKTVEVSALISSVRRDATSTSDTLETAFSSFGTTGLHRNSKELEGRSKAGERQAGLVLNYRRNRLDVGLTYHALRFSDPIDKKESQYNQFAFTGRSNHNAGIFLNFNFKNFTFFTEAAKTMSGGTGFIFGGIGSLGERFNVSLLFRNYSRRFHAFNSNAFAESSVPQNETGIYWGWNYKVSRRYNVSGYIDLFSFPWLRYRSYLPSTGYEWFLRFNYMPSKQVLVFAHIREESKVRNLTHSFLYPVGEGVKRNFVLNLDYGVGQNLRLKTRAQFSTFHLSGKTSKGFALAQDVSVGVHRFVFTARYAVFDTEDYDNRQYVFENDVWLAYSMQAYDGTGVRRYFLVEYKVNKRISFWFRFAATRFQNQETIGSGVDSIEGNKRNDVKFQVRIKF